MLRTLPGCGHLAGKVAARSRRGLPTGRRSWFGSAHRVGFFPSSPGKPNLGPAGPEEKHPKSRPLLKEWALAVSPFGLLKASLPCHITVGPLDPHKYPNSDRVLVALRGRKSTPQPASDLRLLVSYDEARKEVVIISDGVDAAASLDVRAPVKFDLDVKTSGNGSVKIEQMECASCKVETEKGNSVLQSIKSQKIDIQAKGGKVICLGTLQGNTDIRVSQESSVNIEKLQGSSINIASENGLLKAKYLYGDSSFLTSAAGDILLGTVHGDITLETKTGNITVELHQVLAEPQSSVEHSLKNSALSHYQNCLWSKKLKLRLKMQNDTQLSLLPFLPPQTQGLNDLANHSVTCRISTINCFRKKKKRTF